MITKIIIIITIIGEPLKELISKYDLEIMDNVNFHDFINNNINNSKTKSRSAKSYKIFILYNILYILF